MVLDQHGTVEPGKIGGSDRSWKPRAGRCAARRGAHPASRLRRRSSDARHRSTPTKLGHTRFARQAARTDRHRRSRGRARGRRRCRARPPPRRPAAPVHPGGHAPRPEQGALHQDHILLRHRAGPAPDLREIAEARRAVEHHMGRVLAVVPGREPGVICLKTRHDCQPPAGPHHGAQARELLRRVVEMFGHLGAGDENRSSPPAVPGRARRRDRKAPCDAPPPSAWPPAPGRGRSHNRDPQGAGRKPRQQRTGQFRQELPVARDRPGRSGGGRNGARSTSGVGCCRRIEKPHLAGRAAEIGAIRDDHEGGRRGRRRAGRHDPCRRRTRRRRRKVPWRAGRARRRMDHRSSVTVMVPSCPPGGGLCLIGWSAVKLNHGLVRVWSEGRGIGSECRRPAA